MTKCSYCGEDIEDAFEACWKCGRSRSGDQVADAEAISETMKEDDSLRPLADRLAETNASVDVIAFSKRYSDAYSLARGTIAMGKLIKILGVFVGVAIALLGVVFLSQERGFWALVALIAAFPVGSQIFILGVLVSAQGQILLATLDTAVNTCGTLKEGERALIIRHC